MKEGYFSKKIVEWYQEQHRDLPWRNSQQPYKIWLSEIILQQTRVRQGIPYYLKFIKRYPSIKSLASASEQDVLRTWQGLGYYTRARNLHKCARMVLKNFKGSFPSGFDELKQLPGIGDYTAAAISSIAFNNPVAVVDGNVYRVLSRVFGIHEDIGSPAGKKIFAALANKLVDKERPGTHNQAVMEFGALHCTPSNPKCEDCVFKRNCAAQQSGHPEDFPVKAKKQKPVNRYLHYFLFRCSGRILMNKRTTKDIWMGLYDFPCLEATSNKSSGAVVKQIFQSKKILHAKSTNNGARRYKHVLTHQIIHARFLELDWPAGKSFPEMLGISPKARWLTPRQMEMVPKPVLISKYLQERVVA